MGCCGGGRSWYGYGNPYPYGQQPQQPQEPVTKTSQDTPLELLKQRLAKGEITLEEYEKLAKVLSS
ncbi:SHOCT domain-containing protein [Alicyclobacillus acidiphilus]|uniref:SHOCT domain-containing protein n=1 Tax=Alicyclobacillus acidiphilus TaxID=182455 RepID=UPI00082E6A2E|nr:SHOCT domain-containing protein [Alicyclobacillus acidiphilus]MCL6444450.1 SHOCT domain-containing protein [Alicyclobacillus sp.]